MKTIDIERLKDNLLTLAKIGRDETGGITRLAYSEEYYRGIDLVKKWMEEASLSVVTDPVYNVLGTRKGKTDKVMLIGSHTDTVEHGGIFDGCLGVLGGHRSAQNHRPGGYRAGTHGGGGQLGRRRRQCDQGPHR